MLIPYCACGPCGECLKFMHVQVIDNDVLSSIDFPLLDSVGGRFDVRIRNI